MPFLGGAASPARAPESEFKDVPISLAGPVFGLVAVAPFFAAWMLTAENRWLSGALMIVAINLLNLVPAPPLDGLYGRIVAFADGSTAVADDGYIRESILRPHARVRAGYAPAMPAFAGRVSETELAALMAYIKSRAAQEASP